MPRRAFATEKKDDEKKDEEEEEGVEEESTEKEKKEDKTSKDEEASEEQSERKNGALVTIGKPTNALRNTMESPTPDKVLVLPLFKRPFFPGMSIPVTIASHEYVNELNAWQKGGGSVGLFLAKNEQDQTVTDISGVHSIGILGRIHNIDFGVPGIKAPVVFLSGSYRIQTTVPVEEYTKEGKLVVGIERIKVPSFDPRDREIQAYSSEIVHTIREIVQHSNNSQYGVLFQEQLSGFLNSYNPKDPGELADLAAALSTAPGQDLQDVLEITDVKKRQKRALELLKGELEKARAQLDIRKKLEDNLSAATRKYQLTEQMKVIKKELGMEHDEKQTVIEKYNKRLEGKKVPEEAMKVIQEELNKMQHLEPSSSEYNVSKNYLDWLTILPWGVFNTESLDIAKARKVLEEDHYGLKDVKERILEFIAVGKLKGAIQGKILCFVGPPGVGKTSIGKSIARCLGREFFRFSVGGLYDVAELKGHRRTYIGAMPGKLIQALKLIKSSNPVILIDEIDKLGKGHHGDPASALLEVLDPEQNSSFLDHYLDVAYDLSKVLFVCTANTKDTIPGPLLDRMEVIQLSGYVLDEKLHIANKYLIPLARESSAVNAKQLIIKMDAVKALIRDYCREAGVRSLQKQIDKIFRKVALKIAEKAETKVSISESQLSKYVGKPLFNSDRYYDIPPVGVVMGLAYTAMGGATLYIESTVDRLSGKAELHRTTGQLGEVMKESTEIAYTFVKSYIEQVSPGNRFFETAALHMHVPEGATPKDGPSAGCAMATSLLSLALNKTTRKDLAMTGELTLTGKVLPIGGVKEKTIAAQRSGVKHIIFPKDNRKDYEELPANITAGLTVHYADRFSDVYKVAFADDKKPTVSKKRKITAATKKKKVVLQKKRQTEAEKPKEAEQQEAETS